MLRLLSDQADGYSGFLSDGNRSDSYAGLGPYMVAWSPSLLGAIS